MNDFPERFNDAIDNLVNAFMNNELKATKCDKCAVGNMCNGWSKWSDVFITSFGSQSFYSIRETRKRTLNQKAIDKSGYNLNELAKVEKAFENAGVEWGNKDHNSTEDQFDRLMAVVDVLMEIDDISEEHESDIKNKFVVA